LYRFGINDRMITPAVYKQLMNTDRKFRSYKHYLRKSHRYLGVFIGTQFLLWTLGGLFFSWTNIKEIHGDHLRKDHDHGFEIDRALVSPQIAVEDLRATSPSVSITNIRIVPLDGGLFYEIGFRNEVDKEEFVVADASTGKIRPAITEAEAEQIAKDTLITPQTVKNITYLTTENVGKHHEYREKPLPAWAITFDGPDSLTVYLSAQTGQIGAFRTGNWRIFDFLWMLHTMDFQERDNINNYLLRGFSLLGITTILSGFVLFFVSSKAWRGLIRKRTSA
jgi:uncharacterized iron-regulated membrane protein